MMNWTALVIALVASLAINFAGFMYGVGHGIEYYLASFIVAGIVWVGALRLIDR